VSVRPRAYARDTMTERLFTDQVRTSRSKRGHEESLWAFLDRTADPACARVRLLLEDWYAAFPPDHRADLLGRLRSPKYGQFHGAWFELYLYVVHARLGFDIEVHPDMPGIDKHPDYRLTRDGRSFLLEATIPDTNEDTSREARRARVIESIDRIAAPDFSLFFEIEHESATSPPMRDVRRRVARWLDGLDWESERRRVGHGGAVDLATHRDRAGDWRFRFHAWPRMSEHRGLGDGAISVFPSTGGSFDPIAPLRDALERKAKKYGPIDEPLILALRTDWMGTGEDDLARTLYRGGQALWHRDGRIRNRQVTGVLVFSSEMRPWSIAREQPVLWRCPDPAVALPDLPWTQAHIGGAGLVHQDGTFDPGSAFTLPEVDAVGSPSAWPGPAFAKDA
jgi:hypothetical protein